MKKSIATITLAAVAGFSALTASPAVAAPFQNCAEARAAGFVNIPAGSPMYNPSSDADNDGIACEDSNGGEVVGDPTPMPTPTTNPVDQGAPNTPVGQAPPMNQVPPVTPTTPVPSMNQVTPTTPVAPVSQVPQVAQMPVGGAATGVAQDTTDNSGVMALGAGLVLVAVAGGAFAVRRRAVQA